MTFQSGYTSLTGILRIWSTRSALFHASSLNVFATNVFRSYSDKTTSGKPRRPRQRKKRILRYTEQEDATIVSMRQQKLGWNRIHEALPGRSIVSLRLRWQRYLRDIAGPESRYLYPPYSSTELEEVNRLRANGISFKQILQEHFAQRNYSTLIQAFAIWLQSPQIGAEAGKAPTLTPYSAKEHQLLHHLKEEKRLPWSEVAKRMPDRTIRSLQSTWARNIRQTKGKQSTAYSASEDESLQRLRVGDPERALLRTRQKIIANV